ncbi:MAG: GNAT family N-acetyltransferase [Armatimonadetes bacterium]|nr:GNAT family N-acetyltransferase [Armatimonadota bacterium]
MERQVRVATKADAQGILEIYAPIVQETVISFEMEPPSIEEMEGRIERTLVQYPWLVCVENERVLGYVYGSQFRARTAYQWSVEVTVYVHPDVHGQGVGKRLYRALFNILRQQGYVAMYAGVTLPNPASVGIHESMGFQPVGAFPLAGFKFGAWHDVGFWYMVLSEPNSTPAVPTPFPQVDYPLE